MDVERIIDDIGQLEEMFEAPDIRPLRPSDLAAANRRHDDMLAQARGFGSGSTSGFAAGVKPKAGLGFKASVPPLLS